jgi:hypothetical protein
MSVDSKREANGKLVEMVLRSQKVKDAGRTHLLLGISPEQLTPGKMTYHLRRLRLHDLPNASAILTGIARPPSVFALLCSLPGPTTTSFGRGSAPFWPPCHNQQVRCAAPSTASITRSTLGFSTLPSPPDNLTQSLQILYFKNF